MTMTLRNRVGCRCCTPTTVATMPLVINGCNSNTVLPGATVTFTRAGQPTQSGVADAAGAVTITFPATGTWTLAVTPPAVPERFSGAYSILSGTTTTTNPNITVVAGTNASRSVTVLPATGYGCLPGCAYPAQTFLLTDPQGTITVQWSAPRAAFIGCAIRTIQANAATIDCARAAGTGGTTAVVYVISANRGSNLTYIIPRGTDNVFSVRTVRGVTCTQALAGTSNTGSATGNSGCTAMGTQDPFSFVKASASLPTCPPSYAASWSYTGGEGIVYPGSGAFTITASE